MVVLKGVLSDQLYELFLSFFIAVRILHIQDSSLRNRLLNFARSLFRAFVNNANVLCGKTFVTYNVHNLLHIADDVEHFQCSLSDVSSFPFENYLQGIKRTVRGAKRNPLVSVVKRFGERSKFTDRLTKLVEPIIKISVFRRDRYFVSQNGKYCEVKEVIGNGNDRELICFVYDPRKLRATFSKPLDSREWGILTCDNAEKFKKTTCTVKMSDIKQKLYVLKHDNDGLVFVPVLHDFGDKQ
jgi:hypothetical protein